MFENERNWFLFAVILYGISTLYAIFLWRKGFRHHNRVHYVILSSAFVLHTVAMGLRGFSLSRCPVNNLYEVMLFVNWTIVATYLVLGAWRRLRFLGAFASPLVFGIGVFALMPALDAPYGDKPEFSGGWFGLHAALTLLSFGAFGLSSVAAMMYLTQEHDLKFRKLRAVSSLMPPIERLELVVSRLLVAGLIFLTGGLVVGAIYLKQVQGVYYNGDPTILWSVLVWTLYLGLVVMRWYFFQGGRRFAWGAIGSFAFILFTFWGFYLLSGIHQP